MTAQRGFTLLEMVVTIVIGALVVVFAALFITAPVDAYEAQSRRNDLIADASTAWPRIRQDLRRALPNSVRVQSNGAIVVLEMLDTVGYARYTGTTSLDFPVTGTADSIFGNYGPNERFSGHLSVGNTDLTAYSQTASMTTRLNDVLLEPDGVGRARMRPDVPPMLTASSPGGRVYLVRGFVAYLCDEARGTLQRYTGTDIVANPAAHDAPGEFAGAQVELVARGLSDCSFDAPLVMGRSQLVTARLTTTRNNESVTLMHRATLENLP